MELATWANRPEWADELVRQVDAEFLDTGAATPGWPDPHESGDPEQLAYSVCSDPAKIASSALASRHGFGVDVGVGGVGLSTVLLETVPGCGCDHCDHGSDGELEALDDLVLTVARGGVVHAGDGETSTTAGLTGWSAVGHAPVEWLDPRSPVPHSVQRWAGASWRS